MDRLTELDVVRVVQLRQSTREFTGAHAVMRPPQVGDIGTVVQAYGSSSSAGRFTVEMVDVGGLTVWLADFARDELRLEPRP